MISVYVSIYKYMYFISVLHHFRPLIRFMVVPPLPTMPWAWWMKAKTLETPRWESRQVWGVLLLDRFPITYVDTYPIWSIYIMVHIYIYTYLWLNSIWNLCKRTIHGSYDYGNIYGFSNSKCFDANLYARFRCQKDHGFFSMEPTVLGDPRLLVKLMVKDGTFKASTFLNLVGIPYKKKAHTHTPNP